MKFHPKVGEHKGPVQLLDTEVAKPPKRMSAKAREVDPDVDLIGDLELDEKPSIDISRIYGGVSATWLAQIFGADKNTVRKKLATAGIEIVGTRNGGSLYRIRDAAPYLVPPKVDLVSYIKGLRPNDLPPMLNDSYWSAMLKRQKWEENAKDLWRTEAVLEVLGDLNFSIRNTVNLWVEEVDRLKGLTSEQREIITTQADQLLQKIYTQLIELPAKQRTPASIAEEGAIPEGPGGED